MSEKPIIFSAPMVRAILDGRKTQTRRIIPFNRHPEHTTLMNHPQWAGPHETCWMDQSDPVGGGYVIRRGYPVGTRLWVRETWCKTRNRFLYKADCGSDPPSHYTDDWDAPVDDRWRSPIHMPRNASRITLEVTDVRVQRVQEISEEDAIAEGVEPYRCPHADALMKAVGGMKPIPYTSGFANLWNEIHGKIAWAENPWVWAYTFRRVKP